MSDDRSSSRKRFETSPASPNTGNSLRAVVTLALVGAVIIVVLASIIMRLPPGEMTQYLTPLSGLAGLALGYWFGVEKKVEGRN